MCPLTDPWLARSIGLNVTAGWAVHTPRTDRGDPGGEGDGAAAGDIGHRAQHRAPSLADEADLRQAYDAHVGELYRFALRATGDEGAAQDIVQEAFLRAWRAADRFDPKLASLRVWLFAIARNLITDHHRAVGARPWLRGLTDQPDDLGKSVADHAEHLVDEWVISEALNRIGEEQRHALIETYLRDRPYGEVAAEVGNPRGHPAQPGVLRTQGAASSTG